MKRIEVNEQEFIEICLHAPNMAEATRRTGLHPTTFRRKAKQLGCYKPNPSNCVRPRHKVYTRQDIIDRYLSNAQSISTGDLRRLLIKHGFREAKCEICKNTEWLGSAIPLELHHCDGNRYNNELSNLLIVCPTCHSWLTDGNNFIISTKELPSNTLGCSVNIAEDIDSYFVEQIKTDHNLRKLTNKKCSKEHKPREKKPSIVYTYECPQCNTLFITKEKTQKYCSYACAHKSERKFEVTAEELLKMFQEEANYTKIAKKLGVSDNAVKKRCKRLGIYDYVKLLIDEAKRERAIANQISQDADFRRNNQRKSMQTVYNNMDYYIGYTVVADAEVELVRFENTQQLRDAGYSGWCFLIRFIPYVGSVITWILMSRKSK